jgi:hypothetical protein
MKPFSVRVSFPSTQISSKLGSAQEPQPGFVDAATFHAIVMVNGKPATSNEVTLKVASSKSEQRPKE